MNRTLPEQLDQFFVSARRARLTAYVAIILMQMVILLLSPAVDLPMALILVSVGILLVLPLVYFFGQFICGWQYVFTRKIKPYKWMFWLLIVNSAGTMLLIGTAQSVEDISERCLIGMASLGIALAARKSYFNLATVSETKKKRS